mmetsp:Transcript_31569/g.79847  ORF Transcript_31569/g.79847 Transcript_31569/m.79847 type:complete len:205 (+) Transcript_31569:321-935(+)
MLAGAEGSGRISGAAMGALGSGSGAAPGGASMAGGAIWGAGGGLLMRVRKMPRPSIIASSTPPKAAARMALAGPVRRLRKPPVSAPAAMLFQGSSLRRSATREQSKVLKRPPQTAKEPPMRGASRRTASMPPRSRKPDGLFFAPISRWYSPPPTAPIPNAPPTSSRMRSGQGSRPWSTPGPDMAPTPLRLARGSRRGGRALLRF